MSRRVNLLELQNPYQYGHIRGAEGIPGFPKNKTYKRPYYDDLNDPYIHNRLAAYKKLKSKNKNFKDPTLARLNAKMNFRSRIRPLINFKHFHDELTGNPFYFNRLASYERSKLKGKKWDTNLDLALLRFTQYMKATPARRRKFYDYKAYTPLGLINLLEALHKQMQERIQWKPEDSYFGSKSEEFNRSISPVPEIIRPIASPNFRERSRRRLSFGGALPFQAPVKPQVVVENNLSEEVQPLIEEKEDDNDYFSSLFDDIPMSTPRRPRLSSGLHLTDEDVEKLMQFASPEEVIEHVVLASPEELFSPLLNTQELEQYAWEVNPETGLVSPELVVDYPVPDPYFFNAVRKNLFG